MNILGIETSTRAAGVAVVSDGKILAEVIQESKSPHSETLQVQIEEVLKNSGVAEKIDAVAVSIGPGSFTGLRIGLAAAKVLAYAWQIKIIGVPTLQAMAFKRRKIALTSSSSEIFCRKLKLKSCRLMKL